MTASELSLVTGVLPSAVGCVLFFAAMSRAEQPPLVVQCECYRSAKR